MYREYSSKEAIKIINGQITTNSSEKEIWDFIEKIAKTHTTIQVAGVANYIYYIMFKPDEFKTNEFMTFMEKVSEEKG